MRLYLAGPMTGIPQFNIPEFDRVAGLLRSIEMAPGFDIEVISPAELDDPETRAISLASPDGAIATLESHGQTHAGFLHRDTVLIEEGGIDGVVVLPGWEKSKGARHETFVAWALNGIPVVRFNERDGSLTTVDHLDLYRAWTGDDRIILANAPFAHPVSGTR